MATTATQVVFDTPAAEFRLPATDGKTYALDDIAGEKGTVVVFICNHGGFNWSSQHSEVGGCDEHSKAAIGTVWTSAIAIARTAAGGGA